LVQSVFPADQQTRSDLPIDDMPENDLLLRLSVHGRTEAANSREEEDLA
jgi:hypothetical protein